MDKIMLRLCMHKSESSLTGDRMHITSQNVVNAESPCTEGVHLGHTNSFWKSGRHHAAQHCICGICTSQVAKHTEGRTGDMWHMLLTSQSTWLSC